MVQQSWRASESADRRRWRVIRRIAMAILLAGLVVYLISLLVVPFLHPKTHLFLLAAASNQPQVGPELDYLDNDLDSFLQMGGDLSSRGSITGAIRLDNLASQDRMPELATDLRSRVTRSSDVLILYICSTPVMLMESPHLLCGDVKPAMIDISEAAYPVDALLDQVRQCDASVKLLLIDVGRTDFDARLGSLVNRFPEQLRSIVEATDDPSLWVLTSNVSFERSHVVRSLERSAFGYFLVHGLQGAADASGDGYVAVDELHRYVAVNVHAMVQAQTDSLARQTPKLLWGGGDPSRLKRYPNLLAVGNRPREPEPQRLSRSLSVASEASRTASYYGLVRTPTADELAYRALAGYRPGGRVGLVTDQLIGSTLSKLNRVPGNMGPSSGDAAKSPPVAGSGPASQASGDAEADRSSDQTGGPDGGAPTSRSKAAADVTSAGTTSPDPKVERRKELDRLARLLAEAWQLRDAISDRNSHPVVPFDYAPHLWRQLEQRLLNYGRQFRAGNIESAEFADQLDILVGSLREFIAGDELIPGVSDPTLLRIAAARFNDWPDVNAVYSLGLAEVLASQKAVALPQELQTRIDALDAFTDRGEQAEFRAWVEESLPAEYERFQEFWLARRLAREPEVSWPDQQLAMRTRRLGEQVAAGAWSCLPWVREKIHAADRRRLAGERGLLDRIGQDWQQQARTVLNDAGRIYEDAEQDCRDWIAARQRSNDLAARCHGYVRWRWAAGHVQQTDVPGYEIVARLLDTLNRLCDLLQNPDPARLVEIRLLDSQLAQLQQQVETGLSEGAVLRIVGSPGDSWKVESLLLTSLPRAAARLQLLAGAARVEANRLSQMTFPDPRGALPEASKLNRGDWQRVVGLARLERCLARLAVSQGSADDAVGPALEHPPFAELNRVLQELEELASSKNPTAYDLTEALPTASSAMRDFYRSLPDWIGEIATDDQGLRNLEERETTLHDLQVAMRCMQHVSPRDAMRLQGVDVAGTLTRSAMFDQLAWQRYRSQLAGMDAPEDETASLTDMARGYRQLAISIPGQPSLPLDSRPQVHLDGPTSISLTSVAEAPLQLAIHNPNLRTLRIWVVLDYDPTVLQVTSSAETPVYPRQTPETVGMGEYPYASELLGAPTTIELLQDPTATVDLTLRRRAEPTRPVQLICKVLAIDEQNGESIFLRHTVGVSIPTTGTIDLEIAGTPGSWTRADARVTLHAFANRQTEFKLQLRNLISRDQQIGVELLGSEAVATPTLPSGSVPAEQAASLLESFAPTSILVPRFPVTLAAGSHAMNIPFPLPGKESPADSEPAGGKPESAADSAAKKAIAAPADGDALKPLPRNLLLILTDVQTGRKTLRHIALTVQRPRKFLRPQVSYDPERERVELRLGSVGPGLLPPGKTQVHVDLAGDIPAGLHVKLDAELSPESPEVVLFAPLPAAPERIATLSLSVDGYPRAFVYEVPCSSLATDIPEKNDLMEVRITGLPDGNMYKSPAGSIPVRFEVDAPRGAFEGDDDTLFIGYDLDRDRELNGEVRMALHADRQVELFQSGLATDGRLTISSRVGDFQQNLPAVPTRSARLGVLAELSVGDRVAWSNTVEMTVDGQPPRVYQPRLRPGPELAPGAEAELSVLATDDDLSGVATVEVTVDVEGTGKFGGENKPVPAKQDPETGIWAAKLSTKDLAVGVHRVLLRATDHVGNVGEVTTLNIRVMSAESAEVAELNRIPGLVFYGQQPVSQTAVKLISTEGETLATVVTNEQGAFDFSRVPPGKYVLQARGLIHNKFRTAEAEIEVAAPPAQVELQELNLR